MYGRIQHACCCWHRHAGGPFRTVEGCVGAGDIHEYDCALIARAMQLNQPHSEACFDRQTRAVEERGLDEPEPEPELELEPPEPEEEEDRDGDGRVSGVRCCIPARAGLGVAAAVQVGLSTGAVLSVAPTWPARSALLTWKCVVLFAVGLSAAMENRAVATASFIALSAGTAALMGLWSAAQSPRIMCDRAFQQSCAEGSRDTCCYRCPGFHSSLSVSEWEADCSDRMVVEGKLCWYPEWCDSSAVGAASLFSAAGSFNACVATCLCWCQWALLAPRTKEENVEARGKSFAGKSMMQIGKSMSQMPSFLFRPQKGGGAMQQARVTPAPQPIPAPPSTSTPPRVQAKQSSSKPAQRIVAALKPSARFFGVDFEESDSEMLARAERLAQRAEEVEKTRQKAAEMRKLSREGDGSGSRNGLEGAAIKISETTGSIIMGTNGQVGEPDGGSTQVTKRSKQERREKREKREKRREKDSQQSSEHAPRPSKGTSKKGSSKRRPKVGA